MPFGEVTDEVKAIESIKSADTFLTDTIGNSLNNSLPSSQVERFTYQFGNPTFVQATVITELSRDSETFINEVRTAEKAIEDALGVPVQLTVEISTE